jgi:hypothetical protein
MLSELKISDPALERCFHRLTRGGLTVVACGAMSSLACASTPAAPAASDTTAAPDVTAAPDAATPDAAAATLTRDAGTGAARECAPGDSRSCTLDALCTGQQACTSEGRFGACDCGSAARAGSGIVGARCEGDVDCAGGAICLRASGDEYFGSGGPAGGYCTRACTDLDDCTGLDSESLCAQLGVAGGEYCIRSCRSLEPEPGEAKCLNRTDLACVSAAADGRELFTGERQSGYCAARCGSDDECPAGRSCDAELGICTAARADGAEIGARCTLDRDCASRRCEERDRDGVGVCSALCVLGSLASCGYGRAASSRSAACLTPLVRGGGFAEGPGDLGLCRELCDQPSDCARASEGWVCTPISPAAAEFFARSGACAPPG